MPVPPSVPPPSIDVVSQETFQVFAVLMSVLNGGERSELSIQPKPLGDTADVATGLTVSYNDKIGEIGSWDGANTLVNAKKLQSLSQVELDELAKMVEYVRSDPAQLDALVQGLLVHGDKPWTEPTSARFRAVRGGRKDIDRKDVGSAHHRGGQLV